jgi:hypothetical protein
LISQLAERFGSSEHTYYAEDIYSPLHFFSISSSFEPFSVSFFTRIEVHHTYTTCHYTLSS